MGLLLILYNTPLSKILSYHSDIQNTCYAGNKYTKSHWEILSNSASHAQNLGVNFDADFWCHINNIVKSCYYCIPDIARIRKRLSQHANIAIENFLPSSRLDYWISRFYYVPQYVITCLKFPC